MTTFVVSLYLPYTVDFHDLPSPARRSSAPPRQFSQDSTNRLHDKNTTLFPVPTSPRTPAATADAEEFFSQFQSSAATHFPKPHGSRSLVPSDSHLPEWGTDLFFNQPRSIARQAPSDSILEYTKAVEHARAVANSSARVINSRKKSREHSGDKWKWSTEWSVEPAVQGNGGLTNAVRAAQNSQNLGDICWVGTIGFPTDSLEEPKKFEIHEKLESEYDALTVYVGDSDFDGHYAHYCKTILWPVFHYQIPDHPKSKAYEDHSWIYYVNLNQTFADKIIRSYRRGDTVWIHDYHLLLVPAMVRKKLPDAQIGFFLHTAFPSSEVFRCLSARNELLKGILGANLVAFQTREYAHHFLTTCSRLLIVEATEQGVQLDNRFVNIAWLPIGIDPHGLNFARENDEVIEWIKAMQERYHDKYLIVARDKLDMIRGVRQKLLAFELFLNKVVMIQVAISTTDRSELAATVSEIVTRIDSVHSSLTHQPLVFLKQDISFSQYLALLSVADVLMITSLREGMNLTCHEYIVCQDGKASAKKHGPLILSEFTGSASVFEDQEISINPWDYQKCANAIKKALEMTPVEKEKRYNKICDIVMRQTGECWIIELTKSLTKVHEEHFKRDTMSIPRLSVNQLGQKYKAAKKRLFILDYEGTLASHGSPTNIITTSPERVLDALNYLLMDDNNMVYVMSGRPPEELEPLFSRVPGVGFIAENGCFVRDFGTDEWTGLADAELMNSWKESVKGLLKYYEERVEGSWVEERHCSLIFHYGNAEDHEFAARQAGDCANQVNDTCQDQRVHAVPIKDAVLIEPLDWDKGTTAAHIVDKLHQKNDDVDFLLVAGNDRDDEVIFRYANELKSNGKIRDVITVSVSVRNTIAMTTLTQGTTGLLSVLQRLVKMG